MDRRVGTQQGLHLERGNVLAADLEHVLNPAEEEQLAAVVEAAQVAGTHPPAVEDGRPGLSGVYQPAVRLASMRYHVYLEAEPTGPGGQQAISWRSTTRAL
jgi:hypothetical protein